MNRSVALVTGASSGIGTATVRQLLAKGFTVYAAARRVERMQALGDAGAMVAELDVTDDASMTALVERIRREAGRLDILVNNAGYGSYGALEDVPPDEARRQMDVNVFGMARLTQLVLPMMREQRSGRIVNVSSIGGKIWEPFGAWYHASKFAVEGLSDCLRVELKPFGIDVVVIEPGPIKTEWNRIAADSLVETSGKGAYGAYARRYAEKALVKGYESKMVSQPEVVATAIVRAAVARRPKTRYPVGGGAQVVIFLRWLLSDRIFDAMVWSQAKG